MFTFAVSAHAQTRGTWTAAECIGGLDRSEASGRNGTESASGYAAPSQTVLPTLIKWMMLFEDPVEKQLWIGKGMPREWLLPGKSASINGRPPHLYNEQCGVRSFLCVARTRGYTRKQSCGHHGN